MLLVMAFLICLCSAVQAEGGVSVEVILVDGMSVVMLTPQETLDRAEEVFSKSAPDESLAMPAQLTLIDEGAFEGIFARRVDVCENVVSIEKRAFADCGDLREIYIPATVVKVDDLALEGCENVTVYGATGSEAERFAHAAGFDFVDPNASQLPEEHPAEENTEPPVVLPFVRK